MILELINTGTELMLGRVLNTHQQWLCRQLADRGHVVQRQTAVADTAEAIEEALRDALSRADWVIMTGGLGPTSDDLTRERVARLLGRSLREDKVILADVRRFYEERRRPVPAGVEVQALVPEGAQVLPNPNGTAPGLLIRVESNLFRGGHPPAWVALLPGPPRELRPMFTTSLVPLLESSVPGREAFVCETLRSTGLGESQIEERLAPGLAGMVSEGLEVGYCARPGEVDIRLVAHGGKAPVLVRQAADLVRGEIGKHLYADGDETLDEVVVRQLAGKGRTLAVAESCTGGLLASRITDVPGASRVFLGGWITYSNEAKESELGVPRRLIEEHGAVSEAVVRAMVEGARRRSGADYAIAITGVAGPDGGTEAKPVGTVFIALSSEGETKVLNPCNRWDRPSFKRVTTTQALEMLRQATERL